MLGIKKNKKKTKFSFVIKIWRLLKPFQKDLKIIFALTLLFEVVRMAGPYMFSQILDLLIKSNGILSVQTALFVVGGLIGVRFFALLIDVIADFTIVRVAIAADRYTATKAFEKLMNLSLNYHEKISTGAKINIVSKGVDKLINLLDNFVWEFQPVVLQLIVSAVIIFWLNWHVGILFTVSIVPFVIITLNIFNTTKKLRSKRHDAYETSSGELGDTITNITVVKAFAQEEREKTSFSTIQNFIENITWQEIKRIFIAGFGRNILIEMFYGVLLLLGLLEIKRGALTVGGLVFLINITERAYSNIHRLGRIYERAVDASESVDRITNLLAQKQSIKNNDNPIVPTQIRGEIRFKNVSFGYNKKQVLSDINFTIPEGTFTALVGKSGSGKSTIAKLLSRYYDPTAGSILIDNHELKELDIDTYRNSTAVVFQDSPVPNRKIWEVISYAAGKTSYTVVKDRVFEAARLAYAHDFIQEFEEGYHTQIGERGVKLSGGQKQRLAIARALFANPKILIMDEPTSHLDTLSEAMIQKALVEISKERALTKIVIAHRLSTVQHADQILVMQKGKLVEKGTHTELIKKGGVYAKIVAQSELKN